jgi:hypothetical protein
MRHSLQNERGQTIVLVALAFTGLVAFLALVVDGGNIYAQRRQVQNAVDAAAFAGGETMSRPTGSPPTRATNGQVRDAIQNYARRNGVDPSTACPTPPCVKAYYVTQGLSGETIIDTRLIESYGTSLQVPTTIEGRPVIGVHVTADKQFNSFFAGVVGWRTFTVASGKPNPAGGGGGGGGPGGDTGVPPGTGYGVPPAVVPPAGGPPPVTSNGACCAEDLFPVTIANTAFSDENGDGLRDMHFEESDPTYNYVIWEKKLTAPGNFGYLRWLSQEPSATTLAANMNDTSRSGRWNAGDWVPSSTGAMNSSDVRREWRERITANCNTGNCIVIPIYDQTRGTGSNLEYHILAFARFRVTGVCRHNDYTGECSIRDLPSNSEPYVQGKFQQWVFSLCEGACPNYGVTTAKGRPPVNPQRALIGIVKINKLIPAGSYVGTTHIPVDVVHLLDVSGSMNYNFGSPAQKKLTVAKSALIAFNNIMTPTLGDKVGLATFPRTTSSTSYSYSCDQSGSWSTYLWGQNRANLTSNITSVNTVINGLTAGNGTPLAGGLLVARQMALDPGYHAASHAPVLIVASDGIANVRTNGLWTGFSGSTYSDLACNRPAVQDAIDQANIAKSDANGDGKPDLIIFSVAIGTDFNPVSLQAIASEPLSTHFYTAPNAATMQSIYNQIATRTQYIGDECLVTQDESFGASAIVRVRNNDNGQIYQTTATSTGFFAFNNVASGTYEFLSVTVQMGGFTYDIFTDGVGGPILSSNPTAVVGSAAGSYEKNVFLKTDDFTCSTP